MARTEIDGGQILDGTIYDVDVSASAAISGSKITPNFGAQNLVIDTDTLFVDATSNRVGIGTASPDTTLVVASAGAQIASFRAIGVTNPTVAIRTGSTSSLLTFETAGGAASSSIMDASGWLYFTNPNGIIKFSGVAGAVQMTLDTVGFGIGIESPGYKFDTQGTVGQRISFDLSGANPNLRITAGTGGVDPTITFYGVDAVQNGAIDGNSSTGFYVAASRTGIPLVFRTQDTNRARITAAGNFGIGTDSPDTKLDVLGFIKVRGTGSQTVVIRNDGANIDFTDSVGDRTQISQDQGSFTGFNVNDISLTNDFWFRNNSSVVRMVLKAGGNVGLGISAPTHRLNTSQVLADVWKPDIRVGGYLGTQNGYIGTSNAADRIFISGGAEVTDNPNGALWATARGGVGFGTLLALGGLSDGSTRLYADSGLTTDAAYTPTLRMIVTSSGDMGIGTSSPSAKLHVAGNALVAGDVILSVNGAGVRSDTSDASDTKHVILAGGGAYASSRGSMVIVRGNEGSNGGEIAYHTGVGTGSGSSHVWYANEGGGDVVKMTLTAAGDVGIGTASPATKLNVSGAAATIRVDGTGVTDAALTLNSTSTNPKIIFAASAAEKGRINCETTTPELMIHGDSSSEAPGSGYVHLVASAVSAFQIYSTRTIFNETGADMDFRAEGDTDVNLLFLDASTDRVGIGTATPDAKLHVSGNLKTTQYTDTTAAVGASDINWALGAIATKTLAANTTFTFSNAVAGQTVTVFVKQDPATARTVTWPAALWPAATAHVMSAGLSVVDIVTFYYDGTSYFGSVGGQAFA